MKIEEVKTELKRKAMKRHFGKILHFCGDAKSWDDCFTIQEFDDETVIVFWYNLGNGGTWSEAKTFKTGGQNNG